MHRGVASILPLSPTPTRGVPAHRGSQNRRSSRAALTRPVVGERCETTEEALNSLIRGPVRYLERPASGTWGGRLSAMHFAVVLLAHWYIDDAGIAGVAGGLRSGSC